MGFIAPALPWIAKGGSMLLGALGGKKAQSSAQQRSPEEQQALQGEQGAASDLSQLGGGLVSQGAPLTRQSSNYFSTLLRGSRSAQAMATAAPRAAIGETYAGAERGLDRSGVRGAVRDTQAGELARERASRISSLVTGVQPAAAEQLGAMGSDMTRTGGAAIGDAGRLNADMLTRGFENRKYAREEGATAGKSIGSLAFDILNGTLGKFGKKPLPSRGGFGTGFLPPNLPGMGDQF